MSFKRVVEPGKTASGRQRTMDECCFTSTETVGLLGTGAQDGHLDFHTAPELWNGQDLDFIYMCAEVHLSSSRLTFVDHNGHLTTTSQAE